MVRQTTALAIKSFAELFQKRPYPSHPRTPRCLDKVHKKNAEISTVIFPRFFVVFVNNSLF